MEAQMQLRNSNIFPSEEVLKDTLGNVYRILAFFLQIITGEKYGLTTEWKFDNDEEA